MRGAALLVELDGAERECEARFDEVTAICERNGSDDVRVARDEPERQRFWKARKAAFAAMGRISPNYFVQDGVIPRTKLPDVLERIDGLSKEYGLIVANVFHAGDGNLHPLVCFDGAVEGEAERAEELSGRILDVCLEAGGSITGEHGVGVDKKQHMPKMFAEPDLDTFQRLRCAFDPGRARQPRQGHADAAAVRRGAGRVPPAPARGGGPGGPVLMTVEEAAAEIRELEAVRPRGGGTKLGWGPKSDAPDFDTRRPEPHPRAQRRRLHGRAGGRRAARRRRRRRSAPRARCSRSTRRSARATRRRSAASSPTNDSGPLRHRYGGVRDLVVGMTVVLSDGTIAKSGGKVIKNVAGYDLAKLFAGSFGTLGLIAERRRPPAPRARPHGHADGARATIPARSARAAARLAGAAARGRLPRRRLGGRRRLADRALRRHDGGRAGRGRARARRARRGRRSRPRTTEHVGAAPRAAARRAGA